MYLAKLKAHIGTFEKATIKRLKEVNSEVCDLKGWKFRGVCQSWDEMPSG